MTSRLAGHEGNIIHITPRYPGANPLYYMAWAWLTYARLKELKIGIKRGGATSSGRAQIDVQSASDSDEIGRCMRGYISGSRAKFLRISCNFRTFYGSTLTTPCNTY